MPKLKPPCGIIERFFLSPFLPDAFQAILGASMVIVGAYRSYSSSPDSDPHGWFLATVIVLGVAQFAVSFYKMVIAWRLSSDRDRGQVHSLCGCLHTIHALLMSTVAPDDPDPGIRLTVHLPCKAGKQLVQLLDYVGDSRAKKKTAGRYFNAQSGIIGQCYRNREMLVACRQTDDYEGFIRELVSKWGYLESDARSVQPATKSWMAIPLCAEGKEPDAVVYMDATCADFFESSDRKEIVVRACQGIARFIEMP